MALPGRGLRPLPEPPGPPPRLPPKASKTSTPPQSANSAPPTTNGRTTSATAPAPPPRTRRGSATSSVASSNFTTRPSPRARPSRTRSRPRSGSTTRRCGRHTWCATRPTTRPACSWSLTRPSRTRNDPSSTSVGWRRRPDLSWASQTPEVPGNQRPSLLAAAGFLPCDYPRLTRGPGPGNLVFAPRARLQSLTAARSRAKEAQGRWFFG
jgi:hypothetical protein